MFYDRLKSLCEDNGIKITPLVQSLGLSKGNVEKWRNGKLPNAEILIKLSEHFNKPIDFLLCHDTDQTTEADGLSEDERKLLEDYRSLNVQGKEYIRETMEMVRAKYKKAYGSPDMEIAKEIG